MNHLRHHEAHQHLNSPFGSDSFGKFSEAVAKFLGTPQYLITQTIGVAIWITANLWLLSQPSFDPYPFILLNLVFSTQASYAAPLILLAQTRQAERDKAREGADALHREELSQMTVELLQQNVKLVSENTELTTQVHTLTTAISRAVNAGSGRGF